MSNPNPLQYVVSLNPPMMLTNYCMAPLQVYEIEDDNDKDIKKKVSTKIAPAMSSLLYELDLSQDNEKGIFF